MHTISDYVGFIKKIMKLMQLTYPMFRKIEVELTQEQELEQIPDRPSKSHPHHTSITAGHRTVLRLPTVFSHILRNCMPSHPPAVV